ncbi:hypothetical protein WI36_16115 [Burkholderia ubonensis]|uniref:Uncharacterized protein n=1 Tax=Burkholderia ubonensis TaxID=101571 RepID=A0A102KD81_9BURK|nr:hypothetical protein WI35_00260 [Burkholderia ubonensis]KUZ73274.1 hypothetical protein WI36_16115 [Burkholderia ubonensis]KUZ90382.1 hypothetical protein WI39_19150 [Burkholderia ubonensis]KUZ95083.1 hypothetical protein WI38_05520 [Burkholderia ubonensis]
MSCACGQSRRAPSGALCRKSKAVPVTSAAPVGISASSTSRNASASMFSTWPRTSLPARPLRLK